MDKQAFQFSIATELHQYGTDEDGTPFLGEVYYVIATNGQGNRFAHPAYFAGCQVEIHPEEGIPCFIDIREKATREVTDLLKTLKSNPENEFNSSTWLKIPPAYGSEAYDEHATRLWEHRIDQESDYEEPGFSP